MKARERDKILKSQMMEGNMSTCSFGVAPGFFNQ